MIELREIERQMFFADLMKRPSDAALEQRERAFNRVGVHVAAHIFSLRMFDALMIEFRRKSDIRHAVVSIDGRANYNVVSDDALQVLSRDALDNLRANVAATLNQCDNGAVTE